MKKRKLLFSLVLAVVLAFGSVGSVSASNPSAILGGSPVVEGAVFSRFYESLGYFRTDSLTVTSLSASQPVYVVLYSGDGDITDHRWVFYSAASFSIKVYKQEYLNGEPNGSGTSTSLSVKSVEYNGRTYCRCVYGNGSDLYKPEDTYNYPIIQSSYSCDEAIGSILYGDGSLIHNYIPPVGPSFDYSEGTLNTNLGYLANLSVGSYFTNDGTQMRVKVKWDNNHEEWDDSYKVSHYVRFRAVKNGVTGATDLDVSPSELIKINEVLFSSCESSYTNTTDAYRAAFDAYFDKVKSQLSGFTLNLALVCDEYLIIHHGNEYGYWNVLRNDDEDLWDNWSYGVLDSNGKYTPVEDFGEIDTNVGAGDTLEDAENNVQNRPITDGSDASEFGDNLIDMLKSLVDSVGELPQIIGDFFQFLPPEIVGMIGLGLAMILVLRFLGR